MCMFAAHAHSTRAVAFRDAACLLTTGDDGAARLWDCRTPGGDAAPAATLTPARAGVSLRHAAWAPSSPHLLALAHADAPDVHLYDLRAVAGAQQAALRCRFALRHGLVNALAWSPHGACLATGGSDGALSVFETEAGLKARGGDAGAAATVKPTWGHDAPAEINALAWTPAGAGAGHIAFAHGRCVQALAV